MAASSSGTSSTSHTIRVFNLIIRTFKQYLLANLASIYLIPVQLSSK